MAPDHRVGGDAGRPDQEAGIDRHSRRQLDLAVDHRVHRGAQVHGGSLALQEPTYPDPALGRDLGQHVVTGVDEVEVQLVQRDAAVGLGQSPREAQHLAEPLDPGEPAPDEDHGQPPLPLRSRGQARGLVERRQDGVADRDRLLDVLHPDRLLGHTRHWEHPGDRPGGHDHLVVAQLGHRPVGQPDVHRASPVVDPRGAAADQAGTAEVPRQRDHGMPGLDRAGRHLRQEGLVGHVRRRVDHRDLRLAATQPLLQPPRGVEAGVTAAHDHDPLHAYSLSGAHHPVNKETPASGRT